MRSLAGLLWWSIRLGLPPCYAQPTGEPSGETSRRSDRPVSELEFGDSLRFPLLLHGAQRQRPLPEILTRKSSVPLTAVALGTVLLSRLQDRSHSSTPARDGF